jgi:hypothetical protein
MSAPLLVAKLPRPALFALTGALAGLLAALTAGELVWYLLRPAPPTEQSAAPPPPPPAPLNPSRLAEGTSPPAPTAPQLAISCGRVTVYPGGTNTFRVRVARDNFDGPVRIRFETPTVLAAHEIVVPAGATHGQAELVAPEDVTPGALTLSADATATADDQPLSASAPVQVMIAELPPPPPRVGVSATPRVQVYQGGKNTFPVRVVRAGFDEAVSVAFSGLPEGIKIAPVVVPAGRDLASTEIVVAPGTKTGPAKITVTARAAPMGAATAASTEVVAEVLDPARLPIDIVLVLDCTGSMKKSVDGLTAAFPGFADEFARARCDVRFGVVGFRDTTLGQPLYLPRIGGERLTADPALFVAAVRDFKLGGGGGDGESSMDGVAAAADYPLREHSARVIVLVTDGGPKRVDGRMKSMDQTVKHLAGRRIDQLYVVALPQFRKAFEPLSSEFKGRFFDLKTATEENEFPKLTKELAKVITESVPIRPNPKPEPPEAPPAAAVPPLPRLKPPAPPPSSEPVDPRAAAPVPPAPPSAESAESTPAPVEAARKPVAAWALAVVALACLGLVVAQLTWLPGDRPTPRSSAAGYGSGLVVGLVAGGIVYFVFDAVGAGFLARLAGASLFGWCVGAIVPFTERFFPVPMPEAAPEPELELAEATEPVPAPTAGHVEEPAELDLPLVEAPPEEHIRVEHAPELLPELDLPVVEAPTAPARIPAPLPELDLPIVEAFPAATVPSAKTRPVPELDLPPVEAYTPTQSAPPVLPSVPATVSVRKPNITGAAKPGDGCPKCGRKIPGDVGTRYCMLCDTTF